MRRTTIVLPDELHERLRREAFRNRVSLGALIRSRLESKPRTPGRRTKDPLRQVEGIGSEALYSA
jgi:hypothetical protein